MLKEVSLWKKIFQKKKLNLELSKLENFAIENLNKSQKENEIINSLWLEGKMDSFFNKSTIIKGKTDFSILSNYLDYYIIEKEKELDKGLERIGKSQQITTLS